MIKLIHMNGFIILLEACSEQELDSHFMFEHFLLERLGSLRDATVLHF